MCYIFPTSDKVGHDNNRLGRNGIQNMILGRGENMHGKSGREYFERTANIEIGTGDEILIFASSETILKKKQKRVKDETKR